MDVAISSLLVLPAASHAHGSPDKRYGTIWKSFCDRDKLKLITKKYFYSLQAEPVDCDKVNNDTLQLEIHQLCLYSNMSPKGVAHRQMVMSDRNSHIHVQ